MYITNQDLFQFSIVIISVITLVIICGIAVSIVSIIVGRLVIREVRSCIPASMIRGMDSRKKFTIAPITSGRASISTGITERIPSTKPRTNCKAALRIRGKLLCKSDLPY